jgi:hypothetical protein
LTFILLHNYLAPCFFNHLWSLLAFVTLLHILMVVKVTCLVPKSSRAFLKSRPQIPDLRCGTWMLAISLHTNGFPMLDSNFYSCPLCYRQLE